MSHDKPAAWLPSLAGLVGDRLGLDYPRERWPDLERCIRAAARESGTDDTEAFARRLLGAAPDDVQLDVLTHALTIGETYFFRERRSFEVLEQEILPALIAKRQTAGRRLRLWSAGCCTGEEAYSLAIVVDRLLPKRHDWQVTILATDVNPRFLRTASRGEYGAWSFREAPAGLKERYFAPVGTRFAIDRRIRAMVKFAQINLAEPGYPDWRNDTAAMDLILCRNVLMYFSPAQMQQVLTRFEHALVDGGWLAVSATETSVRSLHSLTPIHFDDAVFYRKGPRGADENPPPETPLPSVELPIMPPEATAVESPPEPLAHDDAKVDLLGLARAHADAGRLEAAREAIENALVDAKLDAGAHHLHALILDELGHESQAREALRRALYLEPDFVMAHYALGLIALRHGGAAEAERHFRNAMTCLARHDAQAVLPHSEGLTAGYLRALIEAALAKGRLV